jgi:hypothetical protein
MKAEMARQAEIDPSSAPNILAMRAFSTLADHSQVLYLIGHCEFRYSRQYLIARDLLRRVQACAGSENENYEITERTKLPPTPTPVVKTSDSPKINPAANHSNHPDASTSLNASAACGGSSVKLNASEYLLPVSTHSPGDDN